MAANETTGPREDPERGTSAGTGEQEGPPRLTDPGMIRALSHPVRLLIVEHLGGTGTAATATELAEVVGLSPSATSYHLRAMAKYGLVEEAEGRSDGRERRWRRVGHGWELDVGTVATGEHRQAEHALIAAVLARANEKAAQWFAGTGEEAAEWVQVQGIFDSTVVVTPTELAEITTGYLELIRPYLRRNRPDPPAGSRAISAHLRLVPASSRPARDTDH